MGLLVLGQFLLPRGAGDDRKASPANLTRTIHLRFAGVQRVLRW